MPAFGFSELYKHANDHQYGLAVVNATTLSMVSGLLDCGSELEAPVVISVSGDQLKDGWLPAIEVQARQAKTATGIIAKQLENIEQAILAIRHGCSALALADGLATHTANQIRQIATSCGISIIENLHSAEFLHVIQEQLDSITLDAMKKQCSSWQAAETAVVLSTASYMKKNFWPARCRWQGAGDYQADPR